MRSAPGQSFPAVAVMPHAAKVLKQVMVNNRIQRKVFTRNEGKQGPSLPYIPSGSFAKAMLIEGADANASVTGNESTVPMQLRITGLVEMPNSKTYDATGCFVGLEAWGDVSSERAIVRTRNISCLKDGKTIDMPIKGHVSFRGIRDVLLEDVAQRNIPLSHKKLRRALKAITRSESYLCAMKAGACRYDTEGYVTEHISQEEEAYAAERLDKIRRQNRIKAELQAVLDEK